MFEPKVFRKQTCCIEGSTCDIAGIFRRPHGDSVPGVLYPLRYEPACETHQMPSRAVVRPPLVDGNVGKCSVV